MSGEELVHPQCRGHTREYGLGQRVGELTYVVGELVYGREKKRKHSVISKIETKKPLGRTSGF